MTLQLLRIFKDALYLYSKFSVLLKWLASSVDFWCGFASVGMLPAVYYGLESSALPYSRTGQKPANETGLQGVTYRPCWCFRLFKRTLQKDGGAITRLNITQTASQCTICKNEGQSEVKGESGRERISSLIESDGSHPDTD